MPIKRTHVSVGIVLGCVLLIMGANAQGQDTKQVESQRGGTIWRLLIFRLGRNLLPSMWGVCFLVCRIDNIGIIYRVRGI